MRVALLMNFVAPYRVRLFEQLAARLGAFRIFISTRMESDRFWTPDWGTLDVQVQRNVTLHRKKRDAVGCVRTLQVHVPYDTIPRLLSYRPDAVISVELGPRTIQAALFCILRRTPLVIWCKLSEHTEQGFSTARRLLRRWLVRRAAAIVVNGESGARYIAGLGVPDAAIVRINQPVDVTRFGAAPRTRPAGLRTRMLCVGTLNDRKGVLPFARILIDWARTHTAREFEIWWLGDGDKRAALEALDWPANLRPVFHGNLSYEAVPSIYADCDLLVFPTILDEWGLVVNEAMAAGLPVLGSIYAQAVEELVEDGITGWRFDPQQPTSVRRALDRVQQATPEAWQAMRDAAIRRGGAITPEAAAQRFADLIETIIEKRRPLPAGPATAAQVGMR